MCPFFPSSLTLSLCHLSPCHLCPGRRQPGRCPTSIQARTTSLYLPLLRPAMVPVPPQPRLAVVPVPPHPHPAVTLYLPRPHPAVVLRAGCRTVRPSSCPVVCSLGGHRASDFHEMQSSISSKDDTGTSSNSPMHALQPCLPFPTPLFPFSRQGFPA